jgi:hypothetical protein
MATYNFQSKEFGISDRGVHLLRSGFNYKTIAFSGINRIRIEKGMKIRNWWLVFVLGAVMIFFGVYLSIGALTALMTGNIAPRQARMIFFLFIPLTGGYFIYNSLQTGLVLKIDFSNGDKDTFPLDEIVQKKRVREFKAYLMEKIGTRLHVAE